MITKIKDLTKDSAFSKVVIVTAGSFVGSIFAYFLQIFLGRWLTISDFGTFTALLSASVILGVLASAFATSLVKLVSSLSSQNKYGTLTRIFIELSIGIVSFGLILFTLIFLFRYQLAGLLSIIDPNVLTFFGIFMATVFLTMLPGAYLQGLLRFKTYAIFSVVAQFLRLAVPVALVMKGLGLPGAFIGMGISFVAAYVVGVWLLKQHFSKSDDVNLKHYYKHILTFASSVLFVQVGMSLLNNIDVLLVKHFFDSTSAGLYAGLVTIGKVLLFGASAVGVVMFPMISAAHSSGEDPLKKFKPLLALQTFVVLCGVLVFVLFPQTITEIMFRSTYLPSAVFLPRFALFVGSYVLINFMILFFLAIEKTKVFLFLIPAVVAQIGLILVFHDSIVDVINVNLGVSVSLLTGVMLYYKHITMKEIVAK